MGTRAEEGPKAGLRSLTLQPEHVGRWGGKKGGLERKVGMWHGESGGSRLWHHEAVELESRYHGAITVQGFKQATVARLAF